MTDHIHDWQLAEDGYTRTWATEIRDGEIIATWTGPQDFSDDGDGTYYLQCRVCLLRQPLPDVDITWN